MIIRSPISATPEYTIKDAAKIVGLSEYTARVIVREYGRIKGSPIDNHLIPLDDTNGEFFSFRNLVELHLLVPFTLFSDVPLEAVRDELGARAHSFGTMHPLLDSLAVNGGDRKRSVHLVRSVAVRSRLNYSTENLLAMIFEEYFLRVGYAREGNRNLPESLSPVIRRSNFRSEGVIVRPGVAFSNPVTSFGGITTSAIYERYLAGELEKDLADDYGVEFSDIRAAIDFEARRY